MREWFQTIDVQCPTSNRQGNGVCRIVRDTICRIVRDTIYRIVRDTICRIVRDTICRAGYIVFAGWIEAPFAELDG